MFVPVPLFEHQRVNFSEVFPEKIANKFFNNNEFVSSIERFLEKNALDNVLSFDRKHLKSSHYVGVIKCKNIQFEILPKLLSQCQDRDKILKNLLYMLSYTKQLDIKDHEVANLTSCQNPFIEALIRVFAERLFDALKRLVPKNYETFDKNTITFKGKLKVAEDIRYNPVNKSKFFCEFDSFTEDNLLNQLFLYVATRLQFISQDQHNKKILKFIINTYSSISFRCFNFHELKRIHLNRSQLAFKQPLELARMFLEHSSVDMSKNKFDNIALIWDMNVLFEEFIFEFLKRNREALDICDVKYQKGRRLLKSKDNQHYYANTFIDMLITTKNNPSGIILDTKYKLKSDNYGDFDNADIFQVVTYCRLHNSNDAVLLYPSTNDSVQDHTYTLNTDSVTDTVQIKTAQINMQQDLRTSHNNLVNAFKNIIN